ncbi:hypothetical protein B0H19DRAFT_1248752 [Mycena capillaripes]|nr:hypothetical protein B0H19DRAFT_1248752 [Mycena capillaripes]
MSRVRTPPRAPRAPRAAAASTTADICIRAAVAPKPWVLTVKAFLGDAYLGPAWTQLMNLWWDREEANGFKGTNKSHSAKKRPKQIGDWIART